MLKIRMDTKNKISNAYKSLLARYRFIETHVSSQTIYFIRVLGPTLTQQGQAQKITT